MQFTLSIEELGLLKSAVSLHALHARLLRAILSGVVEVDNEEFLAWLRTEVHKVDEASHQYLWLASHLRQVFQSAGAPITVLKGPTARLQGAGLIPPRRTHDLDVLVNKGPDIEALFKEAGLVRVDRYESNHSAGLYVLPRSEGEIPLTVDAHTYYPVYRYPSFSSLPGAENTSDTEFVADSTTYGHPALAYQLTHDAVLNNLTLISTPNGAISITEPALAAVISACHIFKCALYTHPYPYPIATVKLGELADLRDLLEIINDQTGHSQLWEVCNRIGAHDALGLVLLLLEDAFGYVVETPPEVWPTLGRMLYYDRRLPVVMRFHGQDPPIDDLFVRRGSMQEYCRWLGASPLPVTHNTWSFQSNPKSLPLPFGAPTHVRLLQVGVLVESDEVTCTLAFSEPICDLSPETGFLRLLAILGDRVFEFKWTDTRERLTRGVDWSILPLRVAADSLPEAWVDPGLQTVTFVLRRDWFDDTASPSLLMVCRWDAQGRYQPRSTQQFGIAAPVLLTVHPHPREA